MVSADNLNLDVLELIFSHLSGHDLTCIGLVSRSFLAGAVPTLYRTIIYRLREAKAYDSIMSPFAVLLENKGLAKHVRTIDIQYVPRTRNMKIRSQPHTVFMSECRKAIELCASLHTFRCTESNVVPAFLRVLQGKANLQNLRINGCLTTEQMKLLLNIDTLSESSVLTTMVFYRSGDLNETGLEAILKELPHLRGLHVVQCLHIDHVTLLNLLSHTPSLESLSFTTAEKSRPLCGTILVLPCLQHLALDARYHMTPSPTPAILVSILELLKVAAPTLSSFSIKLPERKIVIVPAFIDRLIEVYGSHLKKLAFLDCSLELESISKIGEECPLLERLDISIPMRDVFGFASLLAPAKSLATLVDVYAHSQHGIRPSLNYEMVEYVMDCVPSLQTLVSDRRVWVADERNENGVLVKLDRRLSYRNRASWFLPSTI